MYYEDLEKVLPDMYGVVERELIKNAYQFAEKAHAGQLRASGEPYITHCVAVAKILVEMQVPPLVVAAALLHDTVEDTETTLEELQKKFSPEIAGLVDGVTKLTNLPRVKHAVGHGHEKEGLAEDEHQSDEESTLMSDELRKAAAKTLRQKRCARR